MVSEMKAQKDLIREVADETWPPNGVTLSVPVGTMIELPRAAVTAKRIAEQASFSLSARTISRKRPSDFRATMPPNLWLFI